MTLIITVRRVAPCVGVTITRPPDLPVKPNIETYRKVDLLTTTPPDLPVEPNILVSLKYSVEVSPGEG